eukprot:MONOS_14551.1-p1 / transcript=MONOS_14551.1 / gene=MONOS_14551 / organism=Monocercomonoides_exilis_PA203 / gene_product=unspecified product / transcript_product=unspecified product / location=Mono_scaffold01022:15791-19003(-) / protein_length=995 / sequence_SO=supercontig / SO=protein_coding / is_pseudo=false
MKVPKEKQKPEQQKNTCKSERPVCFNRSSESDRYERKKNDEEVINRGCLTPVIVSPRCGLDKDKWLFDPNLTESRSSPTKPPKIHCLKIKRSSSLDDKVATRPYDAILNAKEENYSNADSTEVDHTSKCVARKKIGNEDYHSDTQKFEYNISSSYIADSIIGNPSSNLTTDSFSVKTENTNRIPSTHLSPFIVLKPSQRQVRHLKASHQEQLLFALDAASTRFKQWPVGQTRETDALSTRSTSLTFQPSSSKLGHFEKPFPFSSNPPFSEDLLLVDDAPDCINDENEPLERNEIQSEKIALSPALQHKRDPFLKSPTALPHHNSPCFGFGHKHAPDICSSLSHNNLNFQNDLLGIFDKDCGVAAVSLHQVQNTFEDVFDEQNDDYVQDNEDITQPYEQNSELKEQKNCVKIGATNNKNAIMSTTKAFNDLEIDPKYCKDSENAPSEQNDEKKQDINSIEANFEQFLTSEELLRAEIAKEMDRIVEEKQSKKKNVEKENSIPLWKREAAKRKKQEEQKRKEELKRQEEDEKKKEEERKRKEEENKKSFADRMGIKTARSSKIKKKQELLQHLKEEEEKRRQKEEQYQEEIDRETKKRAALYRIPSWQMKKKVEATAEKPMINLSLAKAKTNNPQSCSKSNEVDWKMKERELFGVCYLAEKERKEEMERKKLLIQQETEREKAKIQRLSSLCDEMDERMMKLKMERQCEEMQPLSLQSHLANTEHSTFDDLSENEVVLDLVPDASGTHAPENSLRFVPQINKAGIKTHKDKVSEFRVQKANCQQKFSKKSFKDRMSSSNSHSSASASSFPPLSVVGFSSRNYVSKKRHPSNNPIDKEGAGRRTFPLLSAKAARKIAPTIPKHIKKDIQTHQETKISSDSASSSSKQNPSEENPVTPIQFDENISNEQGNEQHNTTEEDPQQSPISLSTDKMDKSSSFTLLTDVTPIHNTSNSTNPNHSAAQFADDDMVVGTTSPSSSPSHEQATSSSQDINSFFDI